MSAGRDDWDDDDALYGDGNGEDLRPPQRPGGRPSPRSPEPRADSYEDPRGQYRPASGQDPVVGEQTPPVGVNRGDRREPSFGPGGGGFTGTYSPADSSRSTFAQPAAVAADGDWEEIDPYEDLQRQGGATPPPKRRQARKRGRVVPILLAILFLCAFGAIAWYGYNWGMKGGSNDPIPLVSADRTDIKEEPADGEEGGAEAPYQDVEVLNSDGGSDGPESILPGPETPEPIPAAPAPAPSVEEAPQGPAIAETTESAAENGLPPPPPPPSAETETVAPTPAPVPAPAPAPAPEVAAPTPTPAPAPAPAPTQVAAVPEGSVVIQLAAVRTPEAASSEWARMQGDHSELLGDMPLLTQEIEIEGRGTFFRIQTGPFPNRATAQDICAQLKAAGQDCIVKTR